MQAITMLNWADYTILVVLAFSVIISIIRGFVREAMSLITWVAAFWIAFTFYSILASMLEGDIHSNNLRMIVAFGGLFLATLIIGGLINYLIGHLVDRTGLSGTDRVLGLGFGFARGVLLITVMLMLAELTPMPNDVWWKTSVLIPQFQPVEKWLRGYMPQTVNDRMQQVSY